MLATLGLNEATIDLSGGVGNTNSTTPTPIFAQDAVLYEDFAEFQVIPEPMTMLAVGLGITGLGGYIRKRRRA